MPRATPNPVRVTVADCPEPTLAPNCACSNASDVVVISYNPQHYGTLVEWNKMLDVLVPRLHAFASTPGKAALFREPGAQAKP